MKRLFLVVCLLCGGAVPAKALEGFYLGAQVGHVGLTGQLNTAHANAIGFGVDLGFRTAHYLDILVHLNYSSHGGSGGLKLTHPTVGALFHLAQTSELDFSAEVGPGFYFFDRAGTSGTDFGVHFGVNGDVILDESLRLGLGWRWHQVFDSSLGDNFYTIMMRVGWLFE